MSVGAVVVVVIAVALLGAAVWLVRSRSTDPHPWSAISIAMLTSAVCFTVGGDSAVNSDSPSIGTITAAVVGILSVVAGVLALIPRSRSLEPSRLPLRIAIVAIVIGAAGLLLNELV